MPNEKIKILLIEDDYFLLNMYITKFELEGFHVVAAEDGEKGLREAEKEKPDIILLDIMMPKMDGFEVLQHLKSNDRLKDVPVILLTNLSQKEDIDRGMEMGAIDYMIKAHFMPSDVVAKIKKIVGNK